MGYGLSLRLWGPGELDSEMNTVSIKDYIKYEEALAR